MHTFSPAKMWIRGLKLLTKPLAHLHTQFHREIPWSELDMDFMNENQSAHGDREFGFMATRMRKNRKVVVGHWQNTQVQTQLGVWSRVAVAWHRLKTTRVARFGDNMRQVAVTEGDKVEAQIKLGFSVNGYGVGDLVEHVNQVSESQIVALVEQYKQQYDMSKVGQQMASVSEAARIELGLRSFLKHGDFHAFTDTFEDLHGLKQLPGIAAQRLMADGYGFGAEGDWKTAALLRAIKVMDQGLEGGSSFMEDYTYHFGERESWVLGAHMLEICPSIAAEKPRCEVHPLSIGGKEDPARLVFEVDPGPAINISLIDLGHRFRLLVNEVEVIKPPHDLPKLPVARSLWDPKPNLETAAQCWLLAGGAHHTVFSKSISTAFVEDFAEMAELELIVIDQDTKIRDLKDQLRWNQACFH
jgi:L-arabinose isomerase